MNLCRTKHIIFNCECRHEQTAREALDEVDVIEARMRELEAVLRDLHEYARGDVATTYTTNPSGAFEALQETVMERTRVAVGASDYDEFPDAKPLAAMYG